MKPGRDAEFEIFWNFNIAKLQCCKVVKRAYLSLSIMFQNKKKSAVKNIICSRGLSQHYEHENNNNREISQLSRKWYKFMFKQKIIWNTFNFFFMRSSAMRLVHSKKPTSLISHHSARVQLKKVSNSFVSYHSAFTRAHIVGIKLKLIWIFNIQVK